MALPSDAEKTVLVEFRNRVNDVLKTEEQKEDSYLLRWLRARELDLDKSEEMLKEALRWRQENNADNVLDIPLDPFYETEFPYYIGAVDKHCQPVVFIPARKWDFRKVINEGRIEEMKTFTAHFFETICDRIRAQNGSKNRDLCHITQFTMVVDWNGYPYLQLTNIRAVQTMLSFAMAYEAYYPEILFRAYFLNCPSAFNVVLALLKTVIAKRTLAKFSIQGCNPEAWEQVLLEDIDKDQLSIILQQLKLSE